MNVSQHSWHFRFQKRFGSSYLHYRLTHPQLAERPVTLCEYVGDIAGNILKCSLLSMLGCIFAAILGITIYYSALAFSNDWLSTSFMIGKDNLYFGRIGYTIFFAGIAISLAFVFSAWWTSRPGYSRKNETSLLASWYQARKDKICPQVILINQGDANGT